MKIYKPSSIKELLEELNPQETVFLDTETSRLGSDIRLIQVYQEGWAQAHLFDTQKVNPEIVWSIFDFIQCTINNHVIHINWKQF